MKFRNLIMVMVVLCVCMVALGGCDETSDDTVKVPAPRDVKPEKLCDQMASVLCFNAFQCCTGNQLETVFGIEITTTEETCRRDVALLCQSNYAQELYSVEVDRAALDQDGVVACLEHVLAPKGDCFPYDKVDNASSYSDLCATSTLFAGLVEDAGECLFDHDCANDAFCNVNRECKAYREKGEDCDIYPCKNGLYCQLDADGEDRLCVEYQKAGDGCNEMYSVDGNLRCDDGLYCDIPEDDENTDETDLETPARLRATGTCVETKPVGEQCEGDDQCASLECLPGLCDDGSICYMDDDCTGSCDNAMESECETDADCGARCVGGTYDADMFATTCDMSATTSQCTGTCSDDGYTSCATAADCPGTCIDMAGDSLGYSCTENADCEIYEATCDFSQTCEGAGTCESYSCEGKSPCSGTPVCADNYSQLDYCDMAMYMVSHTGHGTVGP